MSAFLLVATASDYNNAGPCTAEAWSLNPFHSRRNGGSSGGRAGRRHRGRVATSTTTSTTKSPGAGAISSSTPAAVDGRLFYQDGVSATEDTSTFMLSVVDVSRAAARDTTATMDAATTVLPPKQQDDNNKPKSIFLPRRSPSRQELQRRKVLLDTELVVGRFAMVTAVVLAVGEILAMTNNQILQ